MNRFLTSATAAVLGLALCGTAGADGRTDHRFDHGRFERDPNADRGRGGWRHFDHGQWQFHRDDLQHFDRWWFDFDPNDLRHFDPWWLDPDDLRHFDRWRMHRYCFHHGHR